MTLHELPVHPVTGLRALGLRKDDRPIWPILGASDDDPGATETVDDGTVEDASDDEEPDDADKPLGPAGEKALHAEKERRRASDRERRALTRRNEAFIAEIAELKALAAKTGGDDDEPIDVEAIRTEAAESAKAEANAEVMVERVTDKIELLALKARFQDPSDAVIYLKHSHEIDDFLDADGKVDAKAIGEALDELLERKPGLAVSADKRPKPKPDPSQGSRKEPAPVDYRTADKATVDAELARLGVRTRR